MVSIRLSGRNLASGRLRRSLGTGTHNHSLSSKFFVETFVVTVVRHLEISEEWTDDDFVNEGARVAQLIKDMQVTEAVLQLANADFALVARVRELLHSLFEVDDIYVVELQSGDVDFMGNHDFNLVLIGRARLHALVRAHGLI